ncbi:MAG: hypothetical protein GY758_33415 [Fuerstiella sp.]|nr:hypothetical protein [Fuerstiella sp.]
MTLLLMRMHRLQSVFMVTVEFRMSDRTTRVTAQPELAPQIIIRDVAALNADAVCGSDRDDSSSGDPALTEDLTFIPAGHLKLSGLCALANSRL